MFKEMTAIFKFNSASFKSKSNLKNADPIIIASILIAEVKADSPAIIEIANIITLYILFQFEFMRE